MSLQFRQEDEGSLLEVVGGIENDKLPIVKLPPSVRKSKLRTGDIVLSVNGISVAGCSAADVTALIRSCGNELYLEILPSKHGHGNSLSTFLTVQLLLLFYLSLFFSS
jgi:C-terminal processing protease CtpA/Prc